MKFLFQKNLNVDNRRPDAGRIYIKPKVEHSTGQRSMAALVLEKGLGGLVAGPGPINFIVINANPTLDDLLAAEFVARLLAGDELPPGCASYARYASLAREGLYASTLAPECSLEGIFLAVRNAHGNPLHNPEIGQRVIADWSRVARVIMEAAKTNKDPFCTPLFDGSEFTRERIFLDNDKKVYEHDVLSGRQWLIQLPGGPPRCGALFLDRPKSLLFKHWSRRENPAHVAGTVMLLMVFWGRGHWIFSTDPTHRLSLLRLAEQLQAAEASVDASYAEANPWFDGKPYQHTLIAAPSVGSQLDMGRVLKIALHWARAKVPRRGRLQRIVVAAAALIAAIALVSPLFRGGKTASIAAATDRGLDRLEISPATIRSASGPRTGKDYALIFACDQYDHWPALANAESDAAGIETILNGQFGFDTHLYHAPTRADMWKALDEWSRKEFAPYDQLFIYVSGHGEAWGNRGFIVAKDSQSQKSERDDEKRAQSMLPLSDVKEMFENSDCRHLFVVLDICHAGRISFADLGALERGVPSAPAKVEYSPKNEFILRKLKPVCQRYMASVGDELASDGQSGQHSPFARAFIKSLNDQGQIAGVVTASKIVSDLNGLLQEPQTGTFSQHRGGDFLFIQK